MAPEDLYLEPEKNLHKIIIIHSRSLQEIQSEVIRIKADHLL